MITIFWPDKEAVDIAEVKFSYNFCKKMSRKFLTHWCCDIEWENYSDNLRLNKALSMVKTEFLLVVTDPEILISPAAMEQMIKKFTASMSVCVPVFNITSFSEQRLALPALYLNVTGYLEVAGMVAANERNIKPIDDVDPAIVLYRKSFFNRNRFLGKGCPIDPFTPLSQCNLKVSNTSKVKKFVNKSAFIHAFGDYYGSQRDDLVQLVPRDAHRVLDVGCAMGGYGKKLKHDRPDIYLTGIEMNPCMADMAREYYDRVVVSRLEDAEMEENFDLINCGDIIEHLYDPWRMLKRLALFLKKGGHLVLSIPNAGHWTIVKDLMKGRFQYIPVGLLCMSHIRWFTQESLLEALTDAGFKVEIMDRQKFAPSPAGATFIDTVCQLGLGDRNSLETNEFILRAIKI